MKVLFLSKYGRLAASTRYRHEQFIPILQEERIQAVISPLLSDSYVKHRFTTGRSSLLHIIFAFIRRSWAIFTARKYDLVVIHCEVFPYIPGFFEWYLRATRVPYLYDFDDAIFHQYDQHRLPLVRKILGNKIAHVIGGAKAVIAGNAYLADYARRTNSNVHIFPTVVDTDLYKNTKQAEGKRTFTIGWIGTPSTAKYVKEIGCALRAFCAKYPAKVVLIGSGPCELEGVPVEVREWSEATEIHDLKTFDVGIMPLSDDPWATGKCGFKLIQYMAAELPVIASPIGMNTDLVTSGFDGYLARTDEEWVRRLEDLYLAKADRISMGQNGFLKVKAAYSLSVQGPRLVKLLRASASPTALTFAANSQRQ
jgi:glycosyltransferase involved in cell wall biosynthesis